MTAPQKTAVVLLSGGLDSATALGIARKQGFRLLAMSFRYGQRHAIEIDAAKRIASAMRVARHVIVDIDLRIFGGSALTGNAVVPKGGPKAERTVEEAAQADSSLPVSDIPVTYVPARNTIFLSYALALAEVEGAQDIFIGVNAIDYSGYPDCRPEFIRAFQQMANLATKAAIEGSTVTIRTPLISMTKAEIIHLGVELGINYGMTSSCYDPDSLGRACGECDSCRLRRTGFAMAQVDDPTSYSSQKNAH